MTILAIPLSPVDACLEPNANLMQALQLMVEHDINHIPMCDGSGRWVGLVAIDDILREILPLGARMEHGLSNLAFAGDAKALLSAHLKELEGKPLKSFIRRDLPVLKEDHPLLETALLLSRHDTPLPVVGRDGLFRGMLSRRAFLHYLMQHAGEQ